MLTRYTKMALRRPRMITMVGTQLPTMIIRLTMLELGKRVRSINLVLPILGVILRAKLRVIPILMSPLLASVRDVG